MLINRIKVFHLLALLVFILLLSNHLYSQNKLKQKDFHIIKSDNLFDLFYKSDKYTKDFKGLRKHKRDRTYNDELKRYIISDTLVNRIWSCDTIYVLSTYSQPKYLYRCIESSYWMVVTKDIHIGYVEYLSSVWKEDNNKYASYFLKKNGFRKFLEEVTSIDVKYPQTIWYRLEVFIRKDFNKFSYTQYELEFPVPAEVLIDSLDMFNLINDEIDVSKYF